MTPTAAVTILILAAHLGTGALVFFSNPRRHANQAFLVMCAVSSIWLAALGGAFLSTDPVAAARYIRLSSLSAMAVPFLFSILRFSIVEPQAGWRRMAARPWMHAWLLLLTVTAALCYSPWFFSELHASASAVSAHPILVPRYGTGILVYALLFMGALGFMVFTFGRDVGRAKGLRRTEIQFVLLGGALGVLAALLLAVGLPLVGGDPESIKLAPVAVIVFDGIVAYAIVTRRIMEVGYFLRLGTAYLLLVVYMVSLYSLSWAGFHWFLERWYPASSWSAHMLAALVIAFSAVPVHGGMQRVANRLFINLRATDVSLTVQKVGDLLRSVSTIDDLLERFARVVTEAVGAEHVIILLAEDSELRQSFPAPVTPEARVVMGLDDALVRVLRASQEPLVTDMIRRFPLSDDLEQAAARLTRLHVAAAVGVESKGQPVGMILLGPRLSGRIYGIAEQRALRTVGHQFAVAIENARLYTEVQNSKIYNETLVDNLVSAVVAVDEKGVVQVFNREAQRITRLGAEMRNRPIAGLPPPLVDCFQSTLETGTGILNAQKTVRHASGDEVPIQLGSSVFHGHEGRVHGVLMVFNDLTEVKRLENQVRRAAHLASLGTLSAGMAHEIKNPLVAIKTFSQLLPTRYDDPDFRKTFSDLIGAEANRIDKVVNQLLSFSRPSRGQKRPVSLREILETALRLISAGREKREIRLKTAWCTQSDVINGEPGQLQSAFVNFLLNAVDATPKHGQITVSTAIEPVAAGAAASREGQEAPTAELVVKIEDTGCGIRPEDLPKIFDPFFTTKNHGTGLGLSVVHGIVTEHGGYIDVESTVGKGSSFRIAFPIRKTAEVEVSGAVPAEPAPSPAQ